MAINVLGFQNLTISSTAVSLTPGRAISFIGFLETADVRWRSDGTAPTTSAGTLLRANQWIGLEGNALTSASFIRDGSNDANLQGHYFSVPLAEAKAMIPW